MKVFYALANLGCSLSLGMVGCGESTPPQPPPDPLPGGPHGAITDPALLADPGAMHAAFGRPDDQSPLAFSPRDLRPELNGHRIVPELNVSCPSHERVTWSQPTVSPGADITWATATSCDAVYEVGYSSRGINNPVSPATTLPFAGQTDLYVIKRDFNGKALWAREIGTTASDFGTAVIATECGSPFVYVAGYTNGSLGGPSAGNYDIVLFKFAADGTEVWRRQFGSAQNEQTWSITLDGASNIYLAGQTSGNLPGAGTAFPSGTTSMFLVKFDPGGNRVWTRQVGVNNRTTVARGLTADPPLISGGLYLTGFTSAGFDGQPFAGGSYDAFIAKFDFNGNRQTALTRLVGTPALDQGYGIAVEDDSVYVTGFTNGTLPGKTNLGANTYDAFVRKVDTNLVEQWTDQVGGSTSVIANSGNLIAFGANSIVVAVSTDRTLDGTDTDLGSTDIALVGYTPEGARTILDYLGTPAAEVAQALTSDGNNNLLIGIRTDASWCSHIFGGGGADAVLLRYTRGCLVNAADPTCHIGSGSGDPHMLTYDRVAYDHQGAGHFVLSRGDGVDVQIRECPGSARVSLINAVGMQLDRDTVEYDGNGDLYINGDLTPAVGTMVLPRGGTIYPGARGGLVFADPRGSRVVAQAFSSKWMNVSVIVPATTTGLGGLLGNADSDPSNEFAMDRDGIDRRASLTFFDTYRALPSFTSVWRVFGDDADPRYINHGVDCTDETFPHQPAGLPDLTPAQRAAGDTACAAIPDPVVHDSCVLDVGLTGDPVLATAAADVLAQAANQGQVAPVIPSALNVYFNDFTGQTGPEWDTIANGTTPLGDRVFLGTFANENVQLTLNNLGTHTQLTVSFDLYVINGWDGDGAFGPNEWEASADGQQLASYTFSNTFSSQSFPTFGSPPGTGALEANTLFYPFGDSIYHLTFTFPHTSSDLALDFSASGLSGIFSEGWGLSNFEIQGRH